MSEVDVKQRFRNIIEDNQFKKPKNSVSNYRSFKLDNDLEVFLISNKKILNTSINLFVRIGSAMESREVDGLAHLLEHALFLGTEKYQGANNFGKFVRTHGGITNASTDAAITHFSVSIPTTFFEETLERFSEFFKKPLFSEELLLNEINVINNEFLSKSNNYYTLLEHVFKEVTDDTHIYSKFFYGNLETIKNIPESKGINVRDKLIEFYKNYYSSNNMTLVIISSNDIKNLTLLSRKYFSDIQKGSKVYPCTKELSLNPEYPFTGIANKLIKVNLYTESKEIMFIFPIPRKEFGISKIFAKYLSFFFSPESGDGLLNKIFNEKKLCYKISVIDVYSQLGFSHITISVFLTNNGICQINEVILNIFSSLEIIKNTDFIDEYFCKIKCEYNVKFNNIEENLEYLEIFDIMKSYYLSSNSPNEFLFSHYKTDYFNKEIFRELINSMSIDKMFIVAIGIKFDIDLLIKQNLINVSSHPLYSEIDQIRINKLFKNIKEGFRNRIEQKYIINEKYYRTEFSIWDLSNKLIESIKSINNKKGLDRGQIYLSMKTTSFEFNKCDHKELLKIKPPLLLDIALEFEKYKNNANKLFEISNDLKISNIWKGFFYFYVPPNVFSSSQIIFRSIIPPLFGKKSVIKYGFKNLRINSNYHLYILIDLLTELVKHKINFKFSELLREVDFQIYPTFKSIYHNYSLGIELYLFGKLDNLSRYLFEYSHSLKIISKIDKIEFEIVKENIINRQLILNNQLTYKTLADQVEAELINNGYIDNKLYIKILKNIDHVEIIELSEFFEKNCFFEGIYAGNANINILKGSLEHFINNLRGNCFIEHEKPFIYVNDNPINDNYSKTYYKKIFFEQDQESHIYKKSRMNQNFFDLIDPFSIPPEKNKIFFLSNKYNIKNNITKLSLFFEKEDHLTIFKLQIINQIFFDKLFEYIRQKKQIAYEFNTEINNICDRLLTYSFIIQTDHNIIETINTLLECLSEFSPKIFTEELFKIALQERIELISKMDSTSFINEYIKLTNNRSFEYNWRTDLIDNLKLLTYSQFHKWFSNSLKNPPILLVALISNKTDFKLKIQIKKFVPEQFIKLKRSRDIFKIKKIKTFKFYHNVFN